MLLSELPQELLIRIFYCLPSSDLWDNVRKVCKVFRATLLRNSFWIYKARICGLKLPDRIRKAESCEVCMRHCSAAETAIIKWGECDGLSQPKIAQTHFATIDAIKIFYSKNKHKKLCFTGARDRNIILWDMDAVKTNADKDKWIACKVDSAHKGWIWQLCVRNDSELYSAGWDNHLNQWFITDSGLVAGSHLSMDTAVLSCVNDGDHILYTSTYRSGPLRCDTRAGLSIIDKLMCHGSKSVFGMATGNDTNYLYSIGEDNRLVLVDKRMFSEPIRSWKAESAISKVYYTPSYLGVSLRNGLLQFMDLETLNIENTLWVESNSPVKPDGENNAKNFFCIALSKGATFCAYGYKLKAYTAGLSSRLLNVTHVDAMITQDNKEFFNIERRKMDCYKDCLVTGSGLGTVTFYE